MFLLQIHLRGMMLVFNNVVLCDTDHMVSKESLNLNGSSLAFVFNFTTFYNTSLDQYYFFFFKEETKLTKV